LSDSLTHQRFSVAHHWRARVDAIDLLLHHGFELLIESLRRYAQQLSEFLSGQLQADPVLSGVSLMIPSKASTTEASTRSSQRKVAMAATLLNTAVRNSCIDIICSRAPLVLVPISPRA
jgi:hypothetical protein